MQLDDRGDHTQTQAQAFDVPTFVRAIKAPHTISAIQILRFSEKPA
jgi:hypothetical protein